MLNTFKYNIYFVNLAALSPLIIILIVLVNLQASLAEILHISMFNINAGLKEQLGGRFAWN